MRYPRLTVLTLVLAGALVGVAPVAGQQPARLDVSTIGPQVGTVAPAFAGTDQNGATRSLKSAAGPKGTMLVFFRSADW
jgi:hypothetical protein